MTLQEWFDDFKTIVDKFDWTVSESVYHFGIIKKIRGTHKNKLGFCGCPLTCWAYEKTDIIMADCSYRTVGKLFNIEQVDCDYIAHSSDSEDLLLSDNNFREQLLEAVGLAGKK